MIVNSFVIEGISNISRLKLDVGSLNALIAPDGYGKINVSYATALAKATSNYSSAS